MLTEDPKKWWLISDKDVQTIKAGLFDLDNPTVWDGLHALESGLHTTEEIPDDWKKTLNANAGERKKLETKLTVKFFDMEQMEQKFIELGEICRDIGRLRIRLQSEG